MLYKKIIETGNVDFTDTSKMSREEWLELRRTGIGGSDAGAIMGLNQWITPLSVYLDKKGYARFEGNKATEWGNILEDPVRQKAKEELGIEIQIVPGMFTSKEHPFMNANFDGLLFIDGEKEISGCVVSGLGGHEIKTSRTGDGFTIDEIPDSYYAQVQHYMAVTGISFFILTVFIFDRYEGRHYVVLRNDEFIERLIEKEKSFWENNILADAMPAPTGNENELDLVKSLPMPETVELDSESELLIEEERAIDVQIKELEKRQTALKTEIMAKMAEQSSEDADKSIATCGKWRVTVTRQSRKSVDSNALKKAGLYDEYTKESVFKVLRISEERSA